MTPRDLRIGNLIESEGQILPILAIDSDKEYKYLKGSVTVPQIVNGHHISNIGRWIKDINSVPLTEEWLIRLGFKKISNGWMQTANQIGIGFALIIDPGRGLVPASAGNIINYRVIEHIHQLQNLYFALTGSELTINNP